MYKRQSQQSLSVNNKRQHITNDDFLSVAKLMNVKKATNIVNQINEVVANWPKYAEETLVKPELRDAINKTLVR